MDFADSKARATKCVACPAALGDHLCVLQYSMSRRCEICNLMIMSLSALRPMWAAASAVLYTAVVAGATRCLSIVRAAPVAPAQQAQSLSNPAMCCRGHALTVATVDEHHCWIGLPQAWVNSAFDSHDLPCAVRVRATGGAAPADALLSWRGDCSRRDGTVQVPRALARACGLQDGSEVTADIVPKLRTATTVHLTAASAEDWGVMETEAELLTKSILEQMKAVRAGDHIPVWIRRQSSVTVKVVSAEPDSAVALASDSILSIQPPDVPAGTGAAQSISAADAAAANGRADSASSEAPEDVMQKIMQQLRERGDRALADGASLLSDGGNKPHKHISGPVRLRVHVRVADGWCCAYRLCESAVPCLLLTFGAADMC